MKNKNILGILAAAAVIIIAVVLISRYLTKHTPMLIQGTVECTTYKASSKVPGRIDCMKVSQGERVEKGQLLYTLSTPELDAKLQQAEAVKSAASALDQAAVAGARIQQIDAARNMWQKAQAGLELARKTYDRVKNLYEQGVVPAQKMDEASANYEAMKATAEAAKA
ncbi:MAG: biotin/lipoyl-binding protein, partial [Alistipes sp.]|nr:biotin/lipoyl-binding protein [Alistipes sp.]